MEPSILVWPLHHANCPWRVELCAGEEALGEGQGACHNPDDSNHYLCAGGRQPWLQRMNNGHVSAEDIGASLDEWISLSLLTSNPDIWCCEASNLICPEL